MKKLISILCLVFSLCCCDQNVPMDEVNHVLKLRYRVDKCYFNYGSYNGDKRTPRSSWYIDSVKGISGRTEIAIDYYAASSISGLSDGILGRGLEDDLYNKERFRFEDSEGKAISYEIDWRENPYRPGFKQSVFLVDIFYGYNLFFYDDLIQARVEIVFSR